ncbi:hypothetical protein ACFV5N_00820 [Streptomyces sp. NPDC059853]|uniref:hypothetical protein n=1 Tax=Streptomyces sp. NPDC059853 TaxID=3346973 RepID=UPI0036687D0B
MASKAQRDRALAREVRVVELRLQGHSFDAIARELKYADRAGAHKAFSRAMRAALEEQAADRDELAQAELERLDWVIRSMAPALAMGDHRAAQAILGAIDRRTRLLGLDSPQRAEVTIHEPPGTEAERQQRLAAVAAELMRRAEAGGGPLDDEALLSGPRPDESGEGES